MGFFQKRREAAFRKADLGEVKKGGNLLVTIGETTVSKVPSGSIHPKLARDKTMHGKSLLEIAGIPVTRTIPQKSNRDFEKQELLFEKAVDLDKNKLHKHMDEILEIIDRADRKGVRFNVMLSSFGKDINGRIVVRDTNEVSNILHRGPDNINRMLEELKADLKIEGAYSEKVEQKIERFRAERLNPQKKWYQRLF